MKDSPNLDLLRAIAVAFVVASHLRYVSPWGHDDVYLLESLGRLGVLIFFVHTTLVLLLSLDRTKESVGSFLTRRAMRIYPLSSSVVIFMALVLGSEKFNLAPFLSNLFLVQNITQHPSMPLVLWTLPYEMQMYLLLPAVYALTRAGNARTRILLLCLSATGLAFAAWGLGLQFRLLRFVPCFLPGALAFVLWKGQRRIAPWALFASVAAAAIAVPMLNAAGWQLDPLSWIVCLGLGALLPFCAEITNRWLVHIGKTVATYSYGIYLMHPIAIGLAFSSGKAGPLQWAVFAIALAALSLLAYRFIERPGIALGTRLAAGMRRPTAPSGRQHPDGSLRLHGER